MRGERVDVRRVDGGAAVAAQVAIAQVIGDDQHDVGERTGIACRLDARQLSAAAARIEVAPHVVADAADPQTPKGEGAGAQARVAQEVATADSGAVTHRCPPCRYSRLSIEYCPTSW